MKDGKSIDFKELGKEFFVHEKIVEYILKKQKKEEHEIHPNILKIKDLIIEDMDENGFSNEDIVDAYKEDENIN